MATSNEQETVVRYVADRMDNGMSRTQMTNDLMLNGGYQLDDAAALVHHAESWRKQGWRRDG